MYVVVIGMGRVGQHVVRELELDQHDVVAIDADPQMVAAVEDSQDVGTMVGYGSSPKVLKEAGAAKADLVVAVTNDDEVNLVAALAALRQGAKRAVARVQGDQYSGSDEGIQYGLLGIDVVINPRILVAQEMAKIARSRGALEVLGLAGNRVEMVQVEMPASSRMLHKALANLNLPAQTLVAAIVRDGELFVPGGSEVLLPGDRAYLIGHAGKMDEIEDLFGAGKDITRVCIVGGGVVGSALARLLVQSDVEVMLLERDRDRAEELAIDLPDVTVLHGDGTDSHLLEEEQVGSFDLFAAVTKDDEVNLMAGLLAKRSGVDRAVSLAQRPDYADIYRQLGIDIVLSPRTLASENILRYVRQSEVQSLTLLEHGQAEVLELLAREGSRILGTPIKRLNMPRGALIAVLVSQGRVTIPHGGDQVRAGDTVVLITTASARPAVERLFKRRSR
ncbi:MAG: Trk system potassium transporter TrkA [Myxococcota bacterium]|nr:Trk system potassium transporter TrkA [Myxococcota bacterium]